MNNDIIPVTIDFNNNSTTQTQMKLEVRNEMTLVGNPGLYNIVMDKCTLPLMNIPILNGETFNFVIEALDKNDYPPSMEGATLKKFPMTITTYSVEEFYQQINEHLDSILGNYNYARFTYDPQTELLTYHETYSKKALIKIYISGSLRDIIQLATPIADRVFMYDENYYHLNGNKVTDFDYVQNKSTMDLVHTLQKIKIYTDLPLEEHYQYNMQTKALVVGHLLTDIDYNTQSMIGIKAIKYQPTVLREYSLKDSVPINNFRLFFSAYYANGEEIYLQMLPRSYASVNLRFIKNKLYNNIINE